MTAAVDFLVSSSASELWTYSRNLGNRSYGKWHKGKRVNDRGIDPHSRRIHFSLEDLDSVTRRASDLQQCTPYEKKSQGSLSHLGAMSMHMQTYTSRDACMHQLQLSPKTSLNSLPA